MTDGAVLTGESLLFAAGLFAIWDMVLGGGRAGLRLAVTAALSAGLAWARAEMFPLAGMALLVDPGTLDWEWSAYAAWILVLFAWCLCGHAVTPARRALACGGGVAALCAGMTLDLGSADRFVLPGGEAVVARGDPILSEVAYGDLLDLLDAAKKGGGLLWVRSPGQSGEVLAHAERSRDGGIELAIGLGDQNWTARLSWTLYASLAAACLVADRRSVSAGPARGDAA